MSDTTADRQAAKGATKVSSTTADRRKQRGPTGDSTRIPEWATERWQHRVEAEARKRLKRDLHGVGATHR